jgi:hypothetical protein
MIWATMSAKHLFGPYVFEGPVNQGIYLIILRAWFVAPLERLWLFGHVWFQQDGAPARYAITVTEILNEVFRDKWTGSGS